MYPEEICKPANVWKLLERWIKPDDAILERATVYTFDSVIAEEWIKGRFLIAGDAAHQTPPFMGQGMCAGIRDVANLGWKLERIIKKNAPNYLLNSYQSERYPHVKEFIKLTIQMGQVINKTKSSIFAGNATNHEDGPQNLGQLKPILGQGPSAGQTKWRGHLFPQPRLEQGRLLDDQIGNQSALILLAEFQKKLSKKLSKNLMETDIAVIADSSDKLREWFKKTSSKAVLIRPDRYISGTAKTEPELHQLLQLYKRGFC